MKIWFDLFLSFFKTGLFTFGGGYAMLPILKDELVVKHKWVSEEELLNYFSIGQCTPGIIAVNVATFCGYKLKKIGGSLLATFALVLPSLVIITLIASVLKGFAQNESVAHVMKGIRIGVAAVLIKIVFDLSKRVWQNSCFKKIDLSVFFAALIMIVFFKISSVWIVFLTILFALVHLYFERRKK